MSHPQHTLKNQEGKGQLTPPSSYQDCGEKKRGTLK